MSVGEASFTPPQLYAVIGILVFLFSGVLLARKVFAYATTDDLEKLEKNISLEMEKHRIERHQMRHEITRIEVSVAKIETRIEINTIKLVNLDVKMEALPDKILERLKGNKI